MGVELAVGVVDVGLYGAHADEELGGNLAVLAGGYELEDFELSLAQGFGKPCGGNPAPEASRSSAASSFLR